MTTLDNLDTTLNNQQTSSEEYYYIVKKDDGVWLPILSPFIKTNNGRSGEFITANWFKMTIPNSLEYAIIKIITDYDKEKNNQVSTTAKIMDCISKLKRSNDINTLDFVVMTQSLGKDYFNIIHKRLIKQLENQNTNTATIHVSIPNNKGQYSMTFGLRKDDAPCLYCPCFDLYD